MKRLTLLAFTLLAACGDDGGGSPGDPDAGDEPDAGGEARERIGWIDVVENRSVFDDGSGPTTYRNSQVMAAFYADRPPAFHREVAASGGCRLLTYTPSSCDPACTDGLCVEPNVCEPWPTLVSAGTLSVDGLSADVEIEPQQGYYYPQEVLPEDLFADDASVTATLSGGDVAAATLDADGVPELEVDELSDGEITLTPGEDFVMRWTPAGGGRVRVTLNANNQGHGLPYLGIIVCEAADGDGELTIPAAIHDDFPETQAWTICAGTDCPQSTIRRFRRDAVAVGDQEIELLVASQISFGVNHDLP